MSRSTPSSAIAWIVQLPARGLVALIRIYQRLVSPVLPAVFGANSGCRFAPTCSHYAVEAMQTHGALRGTWLSVRRVVRCTPLHPGGFDPVPPRCTRVNATPATSSRF